MQCLASSPHCHDSEFVIINCSKLDLCFMHCKSIAKNLGFHGCSIQDEKHIMLHCPVYLSSLENMINSIERTQSRFGREE